MRSSQPNVVKLNVVANDSRWSEFYPPTVLLHGMDSSSHTWKGLMEDLGDDLRALSIDQRGCGLSPLGNPKDFNPRALADDLYVVLSRNPLFRKGDCEENSPTRTRINDTLNTTSDRNTTTSSIRPFVLVGHSMGGRIAMSFAAKYPQLILALVIEDMDIRKRMMVDRRLQCNRARTLAFDRNLPGICTHQGVIDKFVKEEGYLAEQVLMWLDEGKVEGVGATVGGSKRRSYYSQVHPAFRRLCWEHFFETSHGEDTWNDIASILRKGKHKFDVHLMVADPNGTICDEGSIETMVKAFQATPDLLQIHRYPGASHSIHNSKPEDFTKDLEKIIRGFISEIGKIKEEHKRKTKENQNSLKALTQGTRKDVRSDIQDILKKIAMQEAKEKAMQEANIKVAVRSLEGNEEEAKQMNVDNNVKAKEIGTNIRKDDRKKKLIENIKATREAIRKDFKANNNAKTKEIDSSKNSADLWSSQNYRQSTTGASEFLNMPK